MPPLIRTSLPVIPASEPPLPVKVPVVPSRLMPRLLPLVVEMLSIVTVSAPPLVMSTGWPAPLIERLSIVRLPTLEARLLIPNSAAPPVRTLRPRMVLFVLRVIASPPELVIVGRDPAGKRVMVLTTRATPCPISVWPLSNGRPPV